MSQNDGRNVKMLTEGEQVPIEACQMVSEYEGFTHAGISGQKQDTQ